MGNLRRFAVLTALASAFAVAGCGGADDNNIDQPPVVTDDGGLDAPGDTKLDVKSDADAGGDVKDTGSDVKDAGKDADAKTDAKDSGGDAKDAHPDGDGAAGDGQTEGGDTDGDVDGGEVDGGEVDGGEVDGSEVDGSEVDGANTDGDIDGATDDGATVDTGLDAVDEPLCINDQGCDDGLFCNGAETCNPQVGCVPGTPPSCSDAYTCTTDSCDETAKACVHVNDNTACNDGKACNGVEICDPVNGVALTGCVAGSGLNCDDGISCTTDTCDDNTNQCIHTNSDTACSDGQFCNGVETCDPPNGASGTGCKAGTAPNCADTFSCTTDTCDNQTAQCVNAPNNAACSDSQFCNGVEACDPANGAAGTGCTPGTAPSCDDNFSCTTDTCDNNAAACVHTPNNGACGDGKFCNGVEACDPANGAAGTGCKAGTAPDCNDTFSCTTDSCDDNTSSCVHTANNAACGDNNLCNGVETCDPANGAAGTGCKAGTALSCADTYSCTTDTCDPVQGCVHTPSDTACNDGLVCNGTETCNPASSTLASGCVAGTNLICADNFTCTVDSCSESAKGCVHAPDNTACNDNDYCTGTETCDPIGGAAVTGCKAGTPPNCNDSVSCTVDSCSSSTQQCIHIPTDSLCQDNVYCNGNEQCDAVQGCKPAAQPVNCDDSIACTTDACDENQKKCTHTANDALCSDSKFCTGVELCDLQVGCKAGTAVNCDDGRSCTQDACSDSLADCTHTPQNLACDDGLYCNGAETCSVTGPTPSGCLSGTPPACASDGIACTVDACDEGTKTCQHTENNALCGPGQFCVTAQGGCTTGTPCTSAAQCQDGDLCNGAETCVGNICQPGTPKNCDDSVVCTIDDCTAATGVCTHTANNAFCDDGKTCNGVETCNLTQGCVNGTPVICSDAFTCTDDLCEEPAGTCTHVANNANCDDGKLCNGVETCAPSSGGAVGTGCKAGTAYVCPTTPGACTTSVCDTTLNACKPIPDDSKCPCGQSCDVQLGCGNYCTIKTCQGKVYECGDCLDNDGDCRIDAGSDNMCLGPCDNSENSYYGDVPGANQAPCKQDCYFDGDSGAGNDDCYWDHQCDPLEVAPNYPPEDKCDYKPNTKITPTLTCSQAMAAQSQVCLNYCRPLTPNGCDCFGCCEIPGAPTKVWIGSENPSGTGSCHAYIAGPPAVASTVTNPLMCKPCTQVTSCLNTCEHCELCVGKDTLPADCVEQVCPGTQQKCGMPGQLPCAAGFTCITGCCVQNPS
jgi:hypothetical protein